MEPEHFRDALQQVEPEPGAELRFWTARNEELDLWDLIYVSGKDRKNGGGGFFISAFVEGVDDDESRNAGSFEWANDDFLKLGTEGFLSDLRVGPQDRKQLLSEFRVPVGELEGEGGEDVLDIAPVLKISRAEETRTELPIREAILGECLGNG